MHMTTKALVLRTVDYAAFTKGSGFSGSLSRAWRLFRVRDSSDRLGRPSTASS